MVSIALGITAFIFLYWNKSIAKLAVEKHQPLFSLLSASIRENHMGKISVAYRVGVIFLGTLALLGAIASYTGPLQT